MQQYFKYIHLAISASLNIDRIYYKIAIIFMVIMIFVLFIQKNNKSSQHEIISIVPSIALTLLVAYLFLVFVSTVFSRMTKTYYQYELLPFWSYKQIKEDASWIVFWQHGLFWENILNIVMLMPMGILLPIIMRRKINTVIEKHIWKYYNKVGKIVILLSFVTSLTIEVLQLFMKKGLFEFDDIFHNTLGGVLGYVIYLCGSISIYGIKTYINLLRKKADSIIC